MAQVRAPLHTVFFLSLVPPISFSHLSDHLFATYALGAPPSLLQNVYARQSRLQRPAIPSPCSITAETWKAHLGDEKYVSYYIAPQYDKARFSRFYNGYLAFFAAQVVIDGVPDTLEQFVFSEEANFASSSENVAPCMLSRFFGGP